ncbi:winged helix-turn-helix domain-containing protein [Sulfodiicoccus acidiphilus]|nr:winged helix-turn-helix domain-containing protein [Sulfodiicoccus acidiphilus]
MKYRRRTRLEIVKAILSTCKEGKSKTRIMRETNLNFRLTRRWVRRLVELKALNEFQGKYYTTDIGLEMLNKINEYELVRKAYRQIEMEIYDEIGSSKKVKRKLQQKN